MLTITIAWDNDLSWSWENAINALQETLCKVRPIRLCLLSQDKTQTQFLRVFWYCSPIKIEVSPQEPMLIFNANLYYTDFDWKTLPKVPK